MIRAESGPLAGQSFALDRSPFSIGRGAGNDLVLPDTLVSRQHAGLEFQGDRWLLRDLKSSNGTFLNRQAVKDSPQPLRDGDLVCIGDSMFVFTTESHQISPAQQRAGQPVASQPRRSIWIVAVAIAVVLVVVIVVALLLFGGLAGKDGEAGATPGLPSIGLPTGLPSALPTIQMPTGFPTDLPLPTGLPAMPLSRP